MGNHDSYSDPAGGDYREGKQGAEGLFPHPARRNEVKPSKRVCEVRIKRESATAESSQARCRSWMISLSTPLSCSFLSGISKPIRFTPAKRFFNTAAMSA